jgi:glycosyltransferase involved in cell wall biosynthesis
MTVFKTGSLPMRKAVLIFCHGYATQFIDINNQYTQLFPKDKYDVSVVYLVGNPDESIRKSHSAQEVIFLNAPPRETKGLKFYSIKKMLQLQREKSFEIVICHRYKPTYIMLWVARFCKIPVLFSVMHELKTMHSFTRKCSVLLLAQKNIIFAGVSNAVRDDLRKDLWGIPAERIITLYNMIDVEGTESELLDKQTARQQLNVSATDFIFGTIGRLVPAKDQQTLINAFAMIKPHCPDAKLIIMGEGELEIPLKNQIKQLNLTNDIIMTGYIDKASKYMKTFDAFILPSIKEAFGRVLLEAMIAKTPIIAAKTNGIPEVIDQTGILVSAKDTSALAKEMLTLYQMPKEKLSQYGQAGYQRATTCFSLQRFNEIFWALPLVK